MGVIVRNFVHPEDEAALENLKSLPLFSSCVKSFMKIGIERLIHGLSMAQKIRLGPNQLPEIYGYLPPACEFLGIKEPEFYLEMNPAPNANVIGGTRTFLTITSGLLECLEAEEIRAVIAHECGHIACEHVVYHTMAQFLVSSGSRIFGPLAALSLPIRLALLRWYRRSELSADRAAAVYSRAPGPVVSTMIRLAGGSKAITGQVNIDVYREQARAYDKLLDSKWDEILQGYAILGADHPFLAVRTREILDWCEGEQFQRLMQALDAQDSGRSCTACGEPMESGWRFCIHCGHAHSTPEPAVEAAEREGVT